MTTVYFVRHCQPDPSGGYNPEFPLTEQGRRDALLVADVLRDKDISAVYSSSYIRAVQTVAPFAEAAGLEVIREYELRERAAGDWASDFHDYAEMINGQLLDFDCKCEGGESLNEVQRRCMAALRRIVQEHDGEAVVIGTHGMALTAMLRHYFPHFNEKDFYMIVDLSFCVNAAMV